MNDNEKIVDKAPPERAGDVLKFVSESMTPDTFENQILVMVHFKDTVKYGRMALVTVEDLDVRGNPKEFHTFSAVLIDQLDTLVRKGAFPILGSVVTAEGARGEYYSLE